MSPTPVVLVAASAIDIAPNNNGLPGIAALENIVGALLTIALIAALAGMAISAAAWAIGNHSTNPNLVHRGKSGVLVACMAAALAGGAVSLINFFSAAGGKL